MYAWCQSYTHIVHSNNTNMCISEAARRVYLLRWTVIIHMGTPPIESRLPLMTTTISLHGAPHSSIYGK